MKHRLPAAFLAVSLLVSLAGCAPREAEATPSPSAAPTPEPTPEAFRFTRENFPRLNGSTATAPLGRAVAARLLGESGEAVSDLIAFSKTTQSYYQLMEGYADLLLAAEPNGEALQNKEEAGFEWVMEPFANDAFVFLVNEDNPVDSLTVEQVRDIYTGKLTNWSQVGGEDVDIVPFQRNPGAGSQTLMEKLVMDGAPMMEAPVGWVRGEMGDLMEAVRAFDGSRAAIGYSVYYYAEEMEMAGGLKLLQIDGTAPEPDSIRSGTYPLLNPYYAVIPAAAAEGSATRALFDWLLSDEGQALVAAEGYVSARGPGGTRTDGTPIAEKLDRWYEGETAELLPLAEGYGPLVPFSGQKTPGPEGWEFQVNYSKGLMTADGRVVVDPVYFEAAYLRYYEGQEYHPLSLLALGRVADLGETEYGWREGRTEYAVADAEGRWCTGFDYDRIIASADGVLLCSDAGLSLMGLDGTILRKWAWTELGFGAGERPDWASDMPFSWTCGMLTLNEIYDQATGDSTAVYLNTDTGELVSVPGENWSYGYSEDLLSCGTDVGNRGYGYVDKTGAWVIEPRFQRTDDFRGGRAAVRTLDGVGQLIDRAGNVLLERAGGRFEALGDGAGGYWYVEYEDAGDFQWRPVAAYRGDLTPADDFDPALWAGDTDSWADHGWLFTQAGEEVVFYRPGTALHLPAQRIPVIWDGLWHDMASLRQADGAQAVYRLTDGACVVPGGRYGSVSFQTDEATGERYLLAMLPDSTQVLLNTDGKVLHTAETPANWDTGDGGEWLKLTGGLIHSVSDTAVRVWNKDGALLYSRAIYPDWAD